MTRRRTGYVQIDVGDILNEVDDDDLLDEVASRNLTMTGGAGYDDDRVREAHRELLIGRVAEALVILDRLLNPKWKSQASCRNHYERREGRML